jgi:DNA-binding PadR family transcriptional regulator
MGQTLEEVQAEVEYLLASLEEREFVYSYEDRGERRWALTQKGWEVIEKERDDGGSNTDMEMES